MNKSDMYITAFLIALTILVVSALAWTTARGQVTATVSPVYGPPTPTTQHLTGQLPLQGTSPVLQDASVMPGL